MVRRRRKTPAMLSTAPGSARPAKPPTIRTRRRPHVPDELRPRECPPRLELLRLQDCEDPLPLRRPDPIRRFGRSRRIRRRQPSEARPESLADLPQLRPLLAGQAQSLDDLRLTERHRPPDLSLDLLQPLVPLRPERRLQR